MTLTEFLLARIAEDERAVDVPGWYCTDSARGEGWGSRGDECPACGAYMFDGTESATEDAWENHMADHHGRVSAEVEAKRRIVELHEGGDHECSVYDHNGERDGFHYILDGDDCSTLRLLALPYANHPDYDQAWAV